MGVNFPELPPYAPAHSLNHRPATVLPLRDTTLSLPEAILLVLWPLNVKFSTARRTLLAYGQAKTTDLRLVQKELYLHMPNGGRAREVFRLCPLSGSARFGGPFSPWRGGAPG